MPATYPWGDLPTELGDLLSPGLSGVAGHRRSARNVLFAGRPEIVGRKATIRAKRHKVTRLVKVR